MKLQIFLIVVLCILMNAFIDAEETLRGECEGKKLEGETCEKNTDCCFTVTNQLSCNAKQCGPNPFGR